MAHADKKARLLRDLEGDIFDSNHATRRFFRCWLDGSYLGEEHYRDNVAYLRQLMKLYGVGMALEVKVTPWVVNQFIQYMAHDAQCSYGYAQKVIADHIRALPNPMEADLFGALNNDLVDDALDLIRDDMNEYMKENEGAA